MSSSKILTVENGVLAAPSTALVRTGRIVAFIAFTALGAQLAARLPYTPVPVTMQTLFVVLAGVVLGPRDGFLAMLSYLALGAAGVPVFAGFSFGPAVLAGPTGGYLIAFPAAALLAGVLCRTLGNGSLAVLAGAAGGAVLILIMGTLHLSLITGLSPSAAISLAVMPFLLADLIKVLIATLIAGRGRG